MGMTLEHIQQRGSSYRYRRKVPQGLRAIVGKGEIVFPLGKTKAAAIKAYPEFHRKAEAILAQAWDEARGITTSKPTLSAREKFQRTVDEIRAMGFNPYRESYDPDDPKDMREFGARGAVADEILAKYPTDRETLEPIGVTEDDLRLVRALSSMPKAPEATVEDAKRLYLKDRFARNKPDALTQKKDEQRAERAVSHVRDALGRDPAIASITRQDARAVQAHMLRVVNKPSTVERYLNDLRAIISHGIREFDELRGVTNPFTNLPAAKEHGGEAAKDRRKPFTGEQLKKTRERVLTTTRGEDVKLIWRMLEGTGCRLSEVAGLRTTDVLTEGPLPHINVEWHEERRIKTDVSRRKVPLIGDALAAAKEALQAAGDDPMLFPKYGRPGGGTACSQTLMKHVRAVVSDPKVQTHSLRHNMKDRLRKAGVAKVDQDLILGHTMGGIGEDYGGDEARLVVATKAMRKALKQADQK